MAISPAIALTIAGSDPSGGAGIQADLKTFHQFQVYGTSAITLITVQNSVHVRRVELLSPELIAQQIEAVLADMPPQAAKTGALGGIGAIEVVAAARITSPLVVDPVMISKHGAPLMDADARTALRSLLLPLTDLVTPNLHEAAAMSGIEVNSLDSMKEAARIIHSFGPKAVLIKGGHLEGDAVDILFADGNFAEFRALRTPTQHTHGTGCTYSAAITALLARGETLHHSVATAKRFITEAIQTAPGLGQGNGPVNHWSRSL